MSPPKEICANTVQALRLITIYKNNSLMDSADNIGPMFARHSLPQTVYCHNQHGHDAT